MFARSFRIQAPPARLEEGLRVLRESSDAVRGLPGFRHAYALVDHQRGELTTLTLWASAEARDAAQPHARDILAGVVRALGGELSEPQQYEVALEF